MKVFVLTIDSADYQNHLVGVFQTPGGAMRGLHDFLLQQNPEYKELAEFALDQDSWEESEGIYLLCQDPEEFEGGFVIYLYSLGG